MPDENISSAGTSQFKDGIGFLEIDKASTDSAMDQKETEWRNHEWSEQLGLYKNNRNIRNIVDALRRWTIGKGFLTDDVTKVKLSIIRGNGKDTFNGILGNLNLVMEIGGDAFAHIIRSKDKALMINLKPLDPDIVGIVQNRKGIITHYNIYSKAELKQKVSKIMPEDMFHLQRNRIADEIHGTSLVMILKWVVESIAEAEGDWRKVLRFNVKPMRIWKLRTSDEIKRNAFIKTVKDAKENFEDIFLPMDTVETEVSGVAPNATLSPLPWIKDLTNTLHEAGGVPKIIVGNSAEFTEAAGKIVYLSFEQTIEEKQLYNEEQCETQLGVTINLEFPASLRNEILAAQDKGETMQASTPEDTKVGTAGTGGQT